MPVRQWLSEGNRQRGGCGNFLNDIIVVPSRCVITRRSYIEMWNTSTKRILAGCLALASIGATTVIASPAEAHSSCRVVSGRGNGCVADAHHWAYVEDTSADNWGVRIHLWNNLGEHWVAGDPNGSAEGVGGRHTTRVNEVYVLYQVCAGVNGADTSCTSVGAA
jgi:hypothetical protein